MAIISSVLVSVIMRLQEKQVQNKMCMFMANYAVCMFFSFMFMQNIPTSTSFSTFALGVISGILYLTSFIYLEMKKICIYSLHFLLYRKVLSHHLCIIYGYIEILLK